MSVPALYAIVDQATTADHGWEVPALARAYVDGGARLLQLRAPQADAGQLLEWCDEILAYARPLGAQVIVNDRVDIARLAGADGVHVGQTDLDPADVREILPAPAVIGVSTHTTPQVDDVPAEVATYLAVGPVFATSTKDTGYDAVGLSLVRYAATTQTRPVVAIGGMTLEQAPAVLGAGAAAVAVISDLCGHGDPARRVADYIAVLGS